MALNSCQVVPGTQPTEDSTSLLHQRLAAFGLASLQEARAPFGLRTRGFVWVTVAQHLQALFKRSQRRLLLAVGPLGLAQHAQASAFIAIRPELACQVY